ncbi:diphosphate--fructose-6-phosphate 1-phosphotransferase [Mycobacterium dioxanotrophicus]|uniref:Diphosphate--fructose-6-phosphate 1-phosphotransferase n=1 Tax=Mycobacterium dioxanotrophicus TaxID=482462 RepID=A0A1Y0C9J1_9MYCO|nr:diphosphate--fructose-6-phosphate 1-phosphotransferase [Mycobacterium dioxanotrophicus]ART71724.1 diphosphate--fructose-6-phosphate 1-phosphotransferase [Mycobacterium dioxanotrophicus]
MRETADDAMVTYRYVRVGLVALVVFLLASLVLTATRTCLQGSISAFFFTRTHAVFVAALCAIGVCLIAYQGSRNAEDSLLNFSGFMAFVVALIPTGTDGVCKPWLPSVADPLGGVANNITALFVAAAAGIALYLALSRWRPPQPEPTAEDDECATAAALWKWLAKALLKTESWLPKALFVITVIGALALFSDWFMARAHAFAAVGMFLAITMVAVYHACYARAAGRQQRARFYAVIAVLMLATVVLAVVLLVKHVQFGLLLVELLLIGEFALFWAVQTWDVWEPRDKYPPEAVPALANTPQPAR